MSYKWNILKFVGRLQLDKTAIAGGKREPLDDPALTCMTLAQLADLPIPSYVKENCNGSVRVI